MMVKDLRVGFVGGGHMAEALLSGFIRSETLSAGQITVTDLSASRLEELSLLYGVSTVLNEEPCNEGAKQLAECCDLFILAVKPQTAAPVLSAVGSRVKDSAVVLSVIGGMPLQRLEDFFRGPLVRIMPNLPVEVLSGVVGISPNRHCTPQNLVLLQQLLSPLGKTFTIPESLINPLTGISGCGPAYCYMFADALADAGVLAGLSRETALLLASQTLAGAAQMLLTSALHPAQLKEQVCSPGGGTMAGVHSLEKDAFRGIVMRAAVCGINRMIQIEEGERSSERTAQS